MAKAKRTTSRSSSKNTKSDKALWIAAILILLVGLFLLSRLLGWDLLGNLTNPGAALNGNTQNGMNTTGSSNRTGTNQGGSSVNPGGNGSTGGNNGGNGGTGDSGEGINVRIQSESGGQIDVGITEQGQIYVTPQIQPNAQGGTGAQGSVNDQTIIDTNSLLP